MISARAVIFSIKHRWVEEILAGRKTVELRRRPPMIPAGTLGLIYETSPQCCLRASFRTGPTIKDSPDRVWAEWGERSRISRDEFDAYFAERTFAGAIPIRDVQILSLSRSLAELRQAVGFSAPEAWHWVKPELLEYLGLSA